MVYLQSNGVIVFGGEVGEGVDAIASLLPLS